MIFMMRSYIKTGIYDNCLRYKMGKNDIWKTVDKVKVANEVASVSANFNILDLKDMVMKLVKFIHDSNDFLDYRETNDE